MLDLNAIRARNAERKALLADANMVMRDHALEDIDLLLSEVERLQPIVKAVEDLEYLHGNGEKHRCLTADRECSLGQAIACIRSRVAHPEDYPQ